MVAKVLFDGQQTMVFRLKNRFCSEKVLIRPENRQLLFLKIAKLFFQYCRKYKFKQAESDDLNGVVVSNADC
jgi:hypothetical protein